MTFITPFIFGESVMEKVATAGSAAEEIITNKNGVRVCDFYNDERMPMLLLVPYYVRGQSI